MSFISSSYDEGETVIPAVSETDHKLVQDLYDKVKGTKQMKTCKNCIYSRKIIPKNTNCPSEFVCSLSDEDFHDCISDDMSHFSNKILDQSLKDVTDVFTRKEELSKEESEWLIDFITKEDNTE